MSKTEFGMSYGESSEFNADYNVFIVLPCPFGVVS